MFANVVCVEVVPGVIRIVVWWWLMEMVFMFRFVLVLLVVSLRFVLCTPSNFTIQSPIQNKANKTLDRTWTTCPISSVVGAGVLSGALWLATGASATEGSAVVVRTVTIGADGFPLFK